MLTAPETELGTFLSDYSEDAESLQSLVIDEIERALPRIISNLRIPPSLDENDAQLLEFRLSGKPGFRRLNEKDREKAKKKLENETFLRSLRKAQETLSNGILAGTSKSSQVVIVDGSESGGGFGDLLPQIVHPRDAQILEKLPEIL